MTKFLINIREKVIAILTKPETAMIGAVIFCFLWFTLGAINDFLIKPEIKDNNYMSWTQDYLGHYLTLLTLLASTSFWFYYQFISKMLYRKKELKNRALDAARWWFIPALVVCLGLVINNVYYVTYGSKIIIHWSHILYPFWTPLLIL